MAEISVENIEPEAPAEAPEETPATELPEPEQPEPEQPVPAPPELERQPVAFQTAQGEEVSFAAAPKKRGRPKGKAAKPKDAEPKRRGRPPNPVAVPAEPVHEAPPQLDINQLLEPIFKAYMATSEMRKREAKRERYSTLFQGMVGM